MHPYGMTRLQYGDTDVSGARLCGRKTRVTRLDGRSSQTHRRKRIARIHIKRQARNQWKKELTKEDREEGTQCSPSLPEATDNSQKL
jgi:hypothetical protein